MLLLPHDIRQSLYIYKRESNRFILKIPSFHKYTQENKGKLIPESYRKSQALFILLCTKFHNLNNFKGNTKEKYKQQISLLKS